LQGNTLKEQSRILAPRPVEGDTMRQREVEWLESKTPSQITFIEPIKWEVKMNIYVGNLSRETTVDDLRHAFEPFGQVADARIITDRVTGISRGFGFVEMPNEP
jgi:RNA recognition motif-containing protein